MDDQLGKMRSTRVNKFPSALSAWVPPGGLTKFQGFTEIGKLKEIIQAHRVQASTRLIGGVQDSSSYQLARTVSGASRYDMLRERQHCYEYSY